MSFEEGKKEGNQKGSEGKEEKRKKGEKKTKRKKRRKRERTRNPGFGLWHSSVVPKQCFITEVLIDTHTTQHGIQ